MARTVGLIFPVEAAPAATSTADDVKDEQVNTGKPRKKGEIQAYLTSLGIEYPEDATVDELKALMPDNE